MQVQAGQLTRLAARSSASPTCSFAQSLRSLKAELAGAGSALFGAIPRPQIHQGRLAMPQRKPRLPMATAQQRQMPPLFCKEAMTESGI